jgi:acetyltransferase
MAIHPYPRRLVQAKTFKDGEAWMLRPIRPEDAEPLQEFVRGLSDESRYMRFGSMMRELTPRMLARYTRIDYDRELALVATVQLPNPEHRGHPRECIIGFSHYLRNADGRGAEYALVIADAWQRRGLGRELMRGLIEAAEYQGLTYIDGVVLATNRAMLSLMESLGFQNDEDPSDPSMRRVWLDLGETRSP